MDGAVLGKADSIKFQTYKASELVTKKAPKYWDDGNSNETQFDVFNKLDSLTNDNWHEIFEYAKKKACRVSASSIDLTPMNENQRMLGCRPLLTSSKPSASVGRLNFV